MEDEMFYPCGHQYTGEAVCSICMEDDTPLVVEIPYGPSPLVEIWRNEYVFEQIRNLQTLFRITRRV